MYQNLVNYEEDSINLYWRAANYLSVAQIYLHDNILLERSLCFDDLKKRFSGHWGTSPGVNYIYAHINLFAKKTKKSCIVVIGIGHAGVSLMSNLYLDGTLMKYYPQFTHDRSGLYKFVRSCGYGGIRSEINPFMPQVIYDGGELGYSLSTAQGAIMDKENVICFCIIGDGELEAGTIVSSLLSDRIVRDNRSGFVVPIIHLNGYKMGNPSIISLMDDNLSGLGYVPLIVSANFDEMRSAFEFIQNAIEESYKREKKIFPILVMKSVKGWTMPTMEKDNLGIYAHKIPLEDIRSNIDTLKCLENWLKSYIPSQIFDLGGNIKKEVLNIVPSIEFRIGECSQSFLGDNKKLNLPLLYKYEYVPGRIESSITNVDKYLYDVIHMNKNVRIMSPDELKSNKFEKLAKLCRSGNSKVLEVLNENICIGWSQGYIRSGGTSFIISYEAFAPIMTSIVAQYEKYLYQDSIVPWNKAYSSLNFILTSLWWTNTYSHQNPEFVNNLVGKEWNFINVYYPVDGNTFLCIIEKMLLSTNSVNAVIVTKSPTEQILTIEEAKAVVNNGFICWNFQYEKSAYSAIVILIGESALMEAKKCREWQESQVGEYKVLYLSLINLTMLKDEADGTFYRFIKEFSKSIPLIFVFQGYRSVIKQLIFDELREYKVRIMGYMDKSIGSAPTTVKLAVNNMSRYDIMLELLSIFLKLDDENLKLGMLYEEMNEEKRRMVEKYNDQSSKF